MVLAPIRQKAALLAVFFFVAGCQAPANNQNVDYTLDPASYDTFVVGSIAKEPAETELIRRSRFIRDRSTRRYEMTFRQYDPETARLISGGGAFTLSVQDPGRMKEELELVRKVPAGDYALTKVGACYGMLSVCSETYRVGMGIQKLLGDDISDGTLKRVHTYRVRIKQGQVNNLGIFRLGPYKPDWFDNRRSVEETLATLPAISGAVVFTKPILGWRLEERPADNSDAYIHINMPPRPDAATLRQYIVDWARETRRFYYTSLKEFLDVEEKAQFVFSRYRSMEFQNPSGESNLVWQTCATLVYPASEAGKPPNVAVLNVSYPKLDIALPNIEKYCDWYKPTEAYNAQVTAALAKLAQRR